MGGEKKLVCEANSNHVCSLTLSVTFLSPLMTARVNGRKGETELRLLCEAKSVARSQSLCGTTSMCKVRPLNTEENMSKCHYVTYICVFEATTYISIVTIKAVFSKVRANVVEKK